MKNNKTAAIFYAILAALFYAINMPFSKLLLEHIQSTMLAGLLYIGAGAGVGIMFALKRKTIDRAELLSREDAPYTVLMVVLDIIAPICLMYGLMHTTSANASLLNNFEIAATAVIALAVFRENITKRLWAAVFLVTLSSIILSFEDISSLKFSWGSVFVLLAAACWGLENNCTRKISGKSSYQIVTVKGLCSGTGALITGLIVGETLPAAVYIAPALLLGFVAYGLSIFFYIRAQRDLGAAKTSAYYAIAPFAGAFLSFLILRENLTLQYAAALIVMLAGSVLATLDTLMVRHTHAHVHVVTHVHDGAEHTHEIVHTHEHDHILTQTRHGHVHSADELTHEH